MSCRLKKLSRPLSFNSTCFFLLVLILATTSVSSSLKITNSFNNDKDNDFNDIKFTAAREDSTVEKKPRHSPMITSNSSSQIEIKSDTNAVTADDGLRSELENYVHDQVTTEVRRLRSAMSDSIMEEVIAYYGQKIEEGVRIRDDVDNKLQARVHSLTQNLNTLGRNFKSMSRHHRNLVDVVRNNLISLKKKEKEAEQRAAEAVAAMAAAVEAGKQRPVVTRAPLRRRRLRLRKNNEIIRKRSKAHPSSVVVDSHNEHHHHRRRNHKHELQQDQQQQSDLTKATNSHSLPSSQTPPPSLSNIQAKSSPLINERNPRDCQDLSDRGVRQNGVYRITPGASSFDVRCEFEVKKQEQDKVIGWTVLQQRSDGSVKFDRDWKAYRAGFGDLHSNNNNKKGGDGGGEFWLGLANMHALTTTTTSPNSSFALQIVMTDWSHNEYVAEYGSMSVGDELSHFTLHVKDYLANKSNVGDSFAGSSAQQGGMSHDGMPFSTRDRDHDQRFYDNCAQIFGSGWWFNACFQSNLNGVYYHYAEASDGSDRMVRTIRQSQSSSKKNHHSQLKFLRNGIHWNSIDFYKSLKSTKMRVKRQTS